MRLESPEEGRLDVSHAGGGSQPKERHGPAAEVHRIDRRRENPIRRIFG
jgi:hypothetical protein